MYIWVIEPNNPEDWEQHLIKIDNGRRNITDFVESCGINEKVCKHNVSSEESMEFIVSTLELDERSLANTVTIYQDNNYIIQYCFQQDYVEAHPNKYENVYNYFTSIITSDVFCVFGKSVFLKIDTKTKKLLNLSENELFSILANIYFIKSYQVLNGELREVTFLNVTSHILNELKDMKVHKIADWEFYISNNNPIDLTDLGLDKVNINDYNGLVILKRKFINDIAKNYILDDSTSRGVYQDLDEDSLKLLFT